MLEQNTDNFNRREACLEIAKQAITKDRNADYGDPEDNFRGIAAYWNTHLYEVFRHINSKYNRKETGIHYNQETGEWTIADSVMSEIINSTDVATMMVLMKMARTITSPGKMDNWSDSAGYSGCGADVAKAK